MPKQESPATSTRFELARRAVFGCLFLLFVLQLGFLQFFRLLGGFAPYSLNSTGFSRLTGHLGKFYMSWAWLLDCLYLVGLLSLAVLAGSFVLRGNAALHRLRWPWWLSLSVLGLLIAVGIGGRFLPQVDRFSETEAIFQRLEPFAAHGAGPSLWFVVFLWLERAFRPKVELARAKGLLGSLGSAAVGCAFLALLLVAQRIRDADSLLNAATHNAPNATELRGAQRKQLICSGSHAVIGTARDFVAVREPDCWAYDDHRPDEAPDTLQRCESLQFKVDVIDQSAPSGTAPSVQTFRLRGVRQSVAALSRSLSMGERSFDANTRETTVSGPRLYVGRATVIDGEQVLQNTSRGLLASWPAPRQEPRFADNPLTICSERQALQEAVRQACAWDFVVVAKFVDANLVPLDPRVQASVYIDIRQGQEPALKGAEDTIRADQMAALAFEVVESLDPLQPAPDNFVLPLRIENEARLEDVRWLLSLHGGEFALRLRRHWSDPQLLTVAPRNWGIDAQGSLSTATWSTQLHDTMTPLKRCLQARTALQSAPLDR